MNATTKFTKIYLRQSKKYYYSKQLNKYKGDIKETWRVNNL